jgi:hypothetical protein
LARKRGRKKETAADEDRRLLAGQRRKGQIPRRILQSANTSAHADFRCELPTAKAEKIWGDFRPSNGGFLLAIYKCRASVKMVGKALLYNK